MLNDPARSLHRHGLLYAAYRCFVAFILFLVFILDLIVFRISYINPDFYFGLLSLYLMVCIGQFAGFSFFSKKKLQLLGFGVIDVCCFAFINLIIGEANMHVGLLFVVTLFVINLVQPSRIGLGLTLASIISVIYLPFLDSWINVNYAGSMANSLILSIMFLTVRLLAGYSVRRFQALEAINIVQSEELSRFQEINHKIMEQVDTGYVVLDANLSILLINPAARRMFNLSDSKAIESCRLNWDLVAILRDRPIFRSESVSFPYKTDSVDIYVTHSVFSKNAKLSLLTIEDMTKTAERLQALKLAALGKLVASIAHEIRNPLASIVQANVLLEGATGDDMQEYREVIERQCERINKIVQSTLDVAKTPNIAPTSISLQKVTERLLKEDLLDISHLVNIDEIGDVEILFDENHFMQIMINLIRNAVRHNDSKVSPQITLKICEFAEFVEIDVIDYGSGVKSDIVKNLFEPFFTTETNGTGLGLHLSKNLCEINKADLKYVESENGTCFRLSCRKPVIL